jgi:eukaryotic-like serine/threonine-protein kinase
MNCPACGRENMPGAARCGGCGKALPSTRAEPTPSRAPAPTPEPAMGKDGGGTIVTSLGVGRSGLPPGATGAFASFQTLAPGMSIGTRYLIEAVLGEGGMGMVYRAVDRELNRTVALKVIRPELAMRSDILDRFKREILLASQVTHKNVVRIHDLGEAGDLRFISMSFIEGESLRSLLDREGAMTPDRGIPIVRQVALALQAAHDAGIVHRDLKPHNVLIDREGQPYVGDFGISRSMDSQGTMTETGAILGTVDYMSPEQARGDVPDHRSDIYSLGIMMFEMFTGTLPFRAANPLSVMVKRVHEDAPQPSVVRPGMPPWLSAIILRAMQRDVKLRYQTLTDLVRDLDRQRATRAARKLLGKRVAVSAAAVLLAGLLGAAGWRFLQSRAAAPVAIKTSLAILPFRNATGDSHFDWVGAGATSVVRTGLVQARALRIAGEDRVDEVLGVLKPSSGEEARPATVQRLGKLVGVENVLSGSLLRIGGSFRIEASLMRVGDTAIEGTRAIVVDGAGEGAIPGMMDDLTRKIRDELGVSRGWGEKTGSMKLSSRSVEALALFGEALTLARAGNQMEAAKRLEAGVAKDPRFAMAQALLARTYDDLGYADKAKEASRQAAEMARDATPYEAAYIRAVRARLTQDLDGAEKAYAEIASLLPNSADAHFDLAAVQEQRGALAEALVSIRRVLDLDPKHAGAHFVMGRILVKTGNGTEAIDAFQSALELHRASGNKEGEATALNGLGNAYRMLGQFEEAARRYDESLTIRRQIGDRRGEVVGLMNLGRTRAEQGQYEDAVTQMKSAIEVARTIGYTAGLGDAYRFLGDIYQTSGRLDEALASYNESLKIMREIDDEARLAATLSSVGYVNASLGHYLDAFFVLKEALAKRRAIGDKGEITRSLIDIGAVEQVQGRYEEALKYDTEALSLAKEIGDKIVAAHVAGNLSSLHDDQGHYAAALALLAEVQKAADETKDATLKATYHLGHGSLLRHLGEEKDAETALKEAVRLGRELGNTSLLAEALAVRGEFLLVAGRRDEALADLKEALTTAQKAGDRRLILLARLEGAKGSGSAKDLEALLSDIEASGLKPLAAPTRLALSRLHLGGGRAAAAAGEAARAIEVAGSLSQRDLLFQARHAAALAFQAQGKPGEAAAQIVEALTPLEEMRQGLDAAQLARFLARWETAAFAADAEPTLKAAGRTAEIDRLGRALRP